MTVERSEQPRVDAEQRGRVRILMMRHEERRNSLGAGMREALAAALAAADGDEEVRVIVLTGAGTKAFASGADIGELQRRTLEEQRATMERGGIYGVVRRVRKPLVAAINGDCLGGGLELASGCDIRIAAPHARFGQPEVALGIIPGGGGTQMLPRLVGQSHAMRLVITGELVDAQEALRIGLVHELAGDPVARAAHVAGRIALKAPMAVRAAKAAARAALDLPFDEGRALEASLFQGCFASADRIEGTTAFLEKRRPAFTGDALAPHEVDA